MGCHNDVIEKIHKKQISHSPIGRSSIGNKCHQLRHALSTSNQASLQTYTDSGLSLDEDWVASRLKFNLVHQNSKHKPQKFSVNFLFSTTTHLFNTLYFTVMYTRKRIHSMLKSQLRSGTCQQPRHGPFLMQAVM